jgi:hypothetical protein
LQVFPKKLYITHPDWIKIGVFYQEKNRQLFSGNNLMRCVEKNLGPAFV